MLPLSEQQMKAYKQIFPELAPDQLETTVLYGMGVSEKNIAYFRSVNSVTVRKTIQRIQEIYKVNSISQLRSIFQVRIFHFSMICDCKYRNKEESANTKIFSDREDEVLYWLSEGKSYPEIAMILGIKTGTVKFHIGNILQKLGIYSVRQAIRICTERNLIKKIIAE
ncbi:response regulator transcription factor [Arsenophonus nasoniae]|uniref:Helix-turn-helix transcriptional regulator n=1 Tax=Arsenophonus nasoniae TaxID=638 RepID=A0AA95K5X5_9GAMM|nr:helix-turn-helix transcriptional regulator [Arsenophonus nasoniae]WGL93738.1 helix-turn-helix transcriptional regulator [Arsenophonus nasoniae]WGL96050.1 helix-turn-helix transcriptional regulator [Arsenophonus nasoniae]